MAFHQVISILVLVQLKVCLLEPLDKKDIHLRFHVNEKGSADPLNSDSKAVDGSRDNTKINSKAVGGNSNRGLSENENGRATQIKVTTSQSNGEESSQDKKKVQVQFTQDGDHSSEDEEESPVKLTQNSDETEKLPIPEKIITSKVGTIKKPESPPIKETVIIPLKIEQLIRILKEFSGMSQNRAITEENKDFMKDVLTVVTEMKGQLDDIKNRMSDVPEEAPANRNIMDATYGDDGSDYGSETNRINICIFVDCRTSMKYEKKYERDDERNNRGLSGFTRNICCSTHNEQNNGVKPPKKSSSKSNKLKDETEEEKEEEEEMESGSPEATAETDSYATSTEIEMESGKSNADSNSDATSSVDASPTAASEKADS